MKIIWTVLLVVTVAAGARAQRPVRAAAPNSFRTFGSTPGFGFGNVVFPGTGAPPPLISSPGFGSSFPQRFGATIGGFRPSGGQRGFSRGFGQIGYPLAYPVYVGGFGFDSGYYGYGQAQQVQPNVTVIMPPAAPQQSGPPVTIYQNFAPDPNTGGTVREYGPGASQGPNQDSSAAAAAPADDGMLFLIALKDSTVYTAVAYWVMSGALHYVTPQGKQNEVSLSLVDRQTSERLNRGRSVDFRLPAD